MSAVGKLDEGDLVAFRDIVGSASPTLADELWTVLPAIELQESSRRAERERIVTIARDDESHRTFDILRTTILRLLRQNKWSTIAITSPTPGCGKTTVGLNLAFSFARLTESRTVLVDLDLRRPQIGNILELQKVGSMERFLTGQIPIEEAFVRFGHDLAIGANCQPVSYSAELLQSPATELMVSDLKGRLNPDVLFFDLPPLFGSDDVMAFLPNVDCVLLVVAADVSKSAEIEACERDLAEVSNVLGVVLNKCKYAPQEYGYYG